MSQICRTCLEEILESDSLRVNDESTKIKEELLACVPELDLSLIPDANMCVYCANSLHAAYIFKQKCLQSEERIRSQKKLNKWLDLDQIKQEPELEEKFDVVHGIGIGMEVVFIRDDGEEADQQSSRLENEPVNSFLNYEEEWTPKTFVDGASGTQSNWVMSNGKTHSMNKNKLKGIRKEQESSICEINNTNMRSKNLLNGEIAFKCDLCTYTTSRENLLKLHVKMHSASKPYQCPKCTYHTSYRQCLQNHLKNCTTTDLKRALKIFKCTQCTFQTPHNEVLKEHMQLHLITYKCTSCSYEVSNMSIFKRHVSTHAGEKTHKCQHCNYQCDDSVALKKHMSSHKENKSFKCHLCSYSSEYGGALANHILTHTGERRFACTLCGYKAIQKGNLKNHMKHHTNKGPFKCLKCSYSAAGSGHLQNHMRKCHGAAAK